MFVRLLILSWGATRGAVVLLSLLLFVLVILLLCCVSIVLVVAAAAAAAAVAAFAVIVHDMIVRYAEGTGSTRIRAPELYSERTSQKPRFLMSVLRPLDPFSLSELE